MGHDSLDPGGGNTVDFEIQRLVLGPLASVPRSLNALIRKDIDKMPRGPALTKGGRCIGCSTAVAWRKDGETHYLYNARLDANGVPIRTGYQFEPSSEGHECPSYSFARHRSRKGQTETAQTAQTETQTAQAVETQTTAQTAHACKPVDTEAIAAAVVPKVRAEVISTLESFGIKQQTVLTVKTDGGKTLGTSENEIQHPAFPDLVRLLAAKFNVYIHGPAGGGKTYGAVQAAKALGRPYAVVSWPGLTAGKALGFTDAGGRTVETAFTRLARDGGVYVADEFDRSLPSVAAALNSALENRVLTIGDVTIPLHADFSFVATGNTDFRGATRQYTAAQPLDLATAARFAFIAWPYGETELNIVAQHVPRPVAELVVTWTGVMRSTLAQEQVDTVWCGPRESERIAQMLALGFTFAQAADMWVWRGYKADKVARYLKAYPYPKIKGV